MNSVRRWQLVRARPEAVPASVRRFNQRAKQRRWQAVRPWLVGAAGLGLAGLLGWLVYGTPVLGVRHVAVRGSTLMSPDEVRAAAAIPPGTPLASLDLAAVRRRVDALPPVHAVRVERDWPTTVLIVITERTPVAAVHRADGSFDLIDGTGVVFRTVPAQPDLPALQLTAPGPADPTTRAALQVLSALTPRLRDELLSLDAVSPAQIHLRLRAGRQVIWGDATDSAAKAQAATALLGYQGSVIDVSAPQFVTVH